MKPTYLPIPEHLQEKLRKAGWNGDMRFDGLLVTQYRSVSLCDWLAIEAEDHEGNLNLFRECIQAGLPLVQIFSDKDPEESVHLAYNLIPRSFNPSIWDMLFEEGLDINQKFRGGETLLMRACDYTNGNAQKDELFQYLLRKNPDFSLKNEEGETVLLRLALESPFDIPWFVNVIENASFLPPKESDGNKNLKDLGLDIDEIRQALIPRILSGIFNSYENASQEEVENLLQFCVDMGANVHVLVGTKEVNLLYFALPRCLKAMPFLIKQGVDLDQRLSDGSTILDDLQKRVSNYDKFKNEIFHEKEQLTHQIIDLVIHKMRDNLTQSIPNAKSIPTMKRM